MVKLIILAVFSLMIAFSYQIESESEYVTEIDLGDDSNRFKSFQEEINKESTNPDNLSFLSTEQTDACELRPHAKESDFYYFFPALKTTLTKEGDNAMFSNSCFTKNFVTLVKLTKAETIINVYTRKPNSIFCKDYYWIATSNIHHIKSVFFHGNHNIVLRNLKDDDLIDIKVNGLKVFGFCSGFYKTLKSLILTLETFAVGLGTNPKNPIPIYRPSIPEYVEKMELDFLERFANFRPTHRGEVAKKILEINKNDIKSGDLILISRLEGGSPMIMIGTGAQAAHCAVAAWIGKELFVLESQDGAYWPKKGIQKNKWDTWVQWAHNADANVVIIPLREEYRQKFDVEKALKWYFYGIEGLNYGYHNFIYTWIDTPTQNLPNYVNQETFLPLFSVIEKISKKTSDLIVTEGLNLRLGTKNLTIHQAAVEAAKRGITYGELMAIKEVDGWKYSDGENYVCSAFVVAFWKHGGLFADLELNANEFTPKDVYQLDIFDLEYKDNRPQICKDADPELPYCQIMGRYQISLKGFSSIKPYNNMNERCPSVAPFYERPDDC